MVVGSIGFGAGGGVVDPAELNCAPALSTLVDLSPQPRATTAIVKTPIKSTAPEQYARTDRTALFVIAHLRF